jgi:membrane-bound lytic murein transglycosylase D
MKQSLLAILLCVASAGAAAGPEPPDDDLTRMAERWATENLEPDVLAALKSGDEKQLRQVLDDVQRRFGGDYVIDLAAVKESVRTVLPLLESYEETLPYALWLKARLDYFDVAEEWRRQVPSVPPGKPAPPAPNPPASAEREVWIQKLATRPWPEHAKPYVTRLKPVFVAEKVPPELVWIAEVESSFDPRARSVAGASGLFQLMPATAQRYGLSTWPLDQRLKPEPSAQAAARHLKVLHDRFQDWRLALAAYNCGEGRVGRLLAQQTTRSYDAIATRLPAETQMYVPKVEATLLRREGRMLGQLRVPAPPPAE